MKVFRIPAWDNSSGVTHVATTWQIASDINFENIIQEVIDSTEYLNYWKVNVVVPVGKIYYVRAKRKFAEVENDIWIGPKKVLNDEAGLSEIIKPEAKIEQPYVENIVLDHEDGLTITLTPYRGTVPHSSTSWVIKDTNTGEILYKSLFDTENLTELNISPTTVDFSNISHITLITLFHGELGVESAPTIETIELSKQYYEIIANKKIVPSDLDYTGSIKELTTRVVTLKRAELFDLTGKKICDGEVVDNEYKFSSACLVPNMSYTVKLTLTFDNDDSTEFTTSYSFFTKTISEKIVFDRGREYKEIYNVLHKDECLVLDKENNDLENNGLNTDIQTLSEETYVGVIPFVAKDGLVKGYFFSKNDGMFNYIKPIEGFDKEFKKYLKVELTPGNILYVDTITTKTDEDGNEYDVRTLHIFKFNPYTFEVSFIKSIDREDEFITDFNSNAYGVLNGEFYWTSIDNNDRTKVIIRKIDKDTLDLVTIKNERLDTTVDKEMDNILFARILGDRFAIIPQYYNDDNEFFGYILDVSKDEIYKLFTIPAEVRNKHVFINTLDNGNILIQRTQLEDGKLYYVVIDAEHADVIETKYQELMVDADLELTSNVKLKSGNILQFGFVDDKGTSVLWS